MILKIPGYIKPKVVYNSFSPFEVIIFTPSGVRWSQIRQHTSFNLFFLFHSKLNNFKDAVRPSYVH